MRIKTSIKNTLRLLHRHQPTYKDIYIISLGRAGSTLLAEMLNSQRGVRLVTEPLLNTSSNLDALKNYFNSHFISDRYVDLDKTDFEKLLKYFDHLSRMKTSNSIYWTDFGKRSHSFRTNRTVFKTHRLTYLFDELLEAVDALGIYLIRHPISHSLSRMRLGWDTYSDAYLAAAKIKNSISDQALKMAHTVLETGSVLQKYVLNWCLENFVFLNAQKLNIHTNKVIALSYEEILAYPEKVTLGLADRFGFSETDVMLAQIKKPSAGIIHSTKEASEQIQQGKAHLLLGSWRSKISDQDEKDAFDILEEFGFNQYQPGNDLPAGNGLFIGS